MFTKLLVADCETGGVPDFSAPADAPHQPRLCSLAAALYDAEYNELRVIDMMVKPDGWEIPAEATAVNGLTQAMLEEGGSPVADVLDAYLEMFEQCDLISCFSANFDLKIIRGELRRAGKPDRYGERPIAELIWATRSACKGLLPPGVKSVNLSHAHEILLGTPFENPHIAVNDMRAAARLFKHLHGKGLLSAKEQKSTRETVAA